MKPLSLGSPGRLRHLVAFALGLALLIVGSAAQAQTCEVRGAVTHTSRVTDLLATPDAYWVATSGGVLEYDRASREHARTYTYLDGLPLGPVTRLSKVRGGSVVAETRDQRCVLRGERFSCSKKTGAAAAPAKVAFEYENGRRITERLSLPEGEFVGTASDGAWLDGRALEAGEGLADPHVTALAVFRKSLWVGTFNGGLMRETNGGRLEAASGPGSFINALVVGRKSLFVGTSEGLFFTADGARFEQVEFVEDAVVGLASDGTSIWATTPGALYRIKDGPGPASDVWWLPGGSRSLQKVSAGPGFVWMGTEDRGAVLMRPTATTMSKDKPFSVFDRSSGLPSSWSLAVGTLSDGSALMTTLREGAVLLGADGSHRALSLPVGTWGLSTFADGAGIWIGTQDGVAHYDPTTNQSMRVRGLPDERVHAILRDPRDPRRVYFGTENGLAWCSWNEPKEATAARKAPTDKMKTA